MAKRQKLTPQQELALSKNKAAKALRHKFPAGSRVEGSGLQGTVLKHIPGFSADGGYVVVKWDNGHTGRVTGLNTAVSRVQDN
jgi:hypothetical protein